MEESGVSCRHLGYEPGYEDKVKIRGGGCWYVAGRLGGGGLEFPPPCLKGFQGHLYFK